MVCAQTLLCILVSLNVSLEKPAFVKGNVIVEKEKLSDGLTGQPMFDLLNLFVKRNESLLGYFVEFFPSISSNGLLIAKVEADKKSGYPKNSGIFLGETKSFLE